MLNERLGELRKFIAEKTEVDETEDGASQQQEDKSKKEKDEKRLRKLLTQIKHAKI